MFSFEYYLSILPAVSFDPSVLNIPNNISLADPTFYKNDRIDMLLGSTVFWGLLCIGQIHLGKNLPILHKTKFGWIIAGSFMTPNTNCYSSVNYLTLDSSIELNKQMTKFRGMPHC